MTDSNGSSASKTLPRGGRQGGLRVLAVYPWTEFWSMGEGRGAPSFFLSVTAFGARGHDMHVLMPGRPRSPLEEDYHGVTLHRFHTSVDFMPDVGRSKAAQHARLATSYLMWRRRAAREVRALAARVMPDVLFGMGALGAPVASSVARELALPNVTRLFGTSLGEVLDNPLKSLLRYREKIAFRCDADYIVLCDDGSGGDEIARGLGVDASRLLFWPNGIDKAALRSGDAAAARRGLSLGDARMILSVSRLHSEKRVDRLVHAVPAVLAERGDVSFVVAGDGPERPALEALASKLGVKKNVRFLGSVSSESLPDLYAAADIFVTLSERTNVGNPLHEAMMSGRAVIALDTGRTGEIVRDGENGVLLNHADLARLPGVMLRLLGDDEERSRLAAAARADADRRLPTIEERQAMEVDIVERAVLEHAGRA